MHIVGYSTTSQFQYLYTCMYVHRLVCSRDCLFAGRKIKGSFVVLTPSSWKKLPSRCSISCLALNSDGIVTKPQASAQSLLLKTTTSTMSLKPRAPRLFAKCQRCVSRGMLPTQTFAGDMSMRLCETAEMKFATWDYSITQRASKTLIHEKQVHNRVKD